MFEWKAEIERFKKYYIQWFRIKDRKKQKGGMNGVMSEENGGESFKHDMRDFELGRAFVKVESHG